MKIEIGESLVYSWLRHVKNCQIAQMNWKLSPKWDKNPKDSQLLRLKEEIAKEFQDSPFDIFKKTSNLDQFLQQAEIDVIGIAHSGDKTTTYFVDVAFHEGGLNYGSTEETIARVLKKYIRSYFIFRRYFCDFSNGIIYFITPKVSADKIDAPLKAALDQLTEVFKRNDCTPDFQFLANDKFNNDVLVPTMALCNEIADTNELFLRSAQLWKMFETEKNMPEKKIASIHNKKEVQVVDKLILGGIMDDKTLKQTIQAVGKMTFVQYFELFGDFSLTNHYLIDLLISENIYTKNSAATKVSNARKIIKAGCAQKILQQIADSDSNKLDFSVKEGAKQLLRKFHS